MKTFNALVSGASLLAMLAASGASAQTLAEIEAAAKWPAPIEWSDFSLSA